MIGKKRPARLEFELQHSEARLAIFTNDYVHARLRPHVFTLQTTPAPSKPRRRTKGVKIALMVCIVTAPDKWLTRIFATGAERREGESYVCKTGEVRSRSRRVERLQNDSARKKGGANADTAAHQRSLLIRFCGKIRGTFWLSKLGNAEPVLTRRIDARETYEKNRDGLG